MRRAFLNRVSDMIRNEPDTTFFTVDMGMWAIRDILEKYPERCTNVGIYEDGMFSIAAGMAKRGLVPTIFGIQPYLIERTLEQIKMDFAYQKCGVNVVGTGAAVDYSKYGYSHYCAEDVQLVKMIPGCEFIAPGNANEFISLFNQTYRNGHPTFFRISDHPNTKYNIDVKFGKANVIQKGNGPTIIAVGVMLDKVMEVYKEKDATILYYTTLEPFDKETLEKNFSSADILVVEPEYKGSLDYDIISALPGRYIRIQHIGFPREIFRNYGTYDDKIEYYNLNIKEIKSKFPYLAVKEVNTPLDVKQGLTLKKLIRMKKKGLLTPAFIMERVGMTRKKCQIVKRMPNFILDWYVNHSYGFLVSLLRDKFNKFLKDKEKGSYTKYVSFGKIPFIANKRKYPGTGKEHFDDDQLLVAIVTKNRPTIIRENLNKTMAMYAAYNIKVKILDSSTNDKTEKFVKKLMSKYPNNLFYKRHVDTDEKSIDAKCLQLLRDNIQEYKYIWLLRDKLCPMIFNNFNSIKETFKMEDDIVVLFNMQGKEITVRTSDNITFLERTFNRLLTLGLAIYKTSFLDNLLKTIPLDEKNYTLYFPVALYQYAERADFSAKICYGPYILSLPATFKPSFWIKDLSWQFFERFYDILMNLAKYEPYKESITKIIKEHHSLLPTVSVYNLLQARMKGGFTPQDVIKYKKQIRFISPYNYWENMKLSLLDPADAEQQFKKILKDVKKGRYKAREMKPNKHIGEFE